MHLLGERKIHPLIEVVLEKAGSGGDHVHSEEPQVGFELPRM
jgi:hypothetical protein